MRTRRVLLVTLSTLSLGLAACGDDDLGTSDTGPATTPPTTATTGVPVEADELAMQVDRTIAIGGDGRVYRPVPEDEADGLRGFAPVIAPPRPPTGWTVAELPAGRLDALYERAGELGLLDHVIEPGPDYDWCCDRIGHALTIGTGSGTLDHVVPYLDADDLDTDEQLAVADMIVELTELAGSDDLGPARPYVPERWRIVPVYDTSGVEVRESPLAEDPDIDDCVVLPTDADADTATGPYRGERSSFAAEPLLPWQTC